MFVVCTYIHLVVTSCFDSYLLLLLYANRNAYDFSYTFLKVDESSQRVCNYYNAKLVSETKNNKNCSRAYNTSVNITRMTPHVYVYTVGLLANKFMHGHVLKLTDGVLIFTKNIVCQRSKSSRIKILFFIKIGTHPNNPP